MSTHEWSYSNQFSGEARQLVPFEEKEKTLSSLTLEVELGYDERMAFREAQRCLNCDAQTVFTDKKCIECDSCVDICPMDCINFIENGPEPDLRARLQVPAENKDQDLYVSGELKTGRVMVKDEDVCLHCGLCAERCPTDAWDMKKFLINVAQASSKCLS